MDGMETFLKKQGNVREILIENAFLASQFSGGNVICVLLFCPEIYYLLFLFIH